MPNLVETATQAGSFKTLVKAVQEAGLAGTLSSPGPYTVFAPSDEAFAKLPQGTIENLMKDRERLKAILTYHVVQGKLAAADVARLPTLKTVQGQEIRIDAREGVKVNEARVVQTDIPADNGIIHVIDRVIMPR